MTHKRFETIVSTQDYLIDNAHEIDNNTIISADRQTSGYGRSGLWDSSDENVYMSLKVPEKSADISEVILCALHCYCLKIGINCRIKLPNDIYVANKKLAGFIVNKVGENYLIGIGMNVARIDHSTRTSILNEVNINVNLVSVIEQIAQLIIDFNDEDSELINVLFNQKLTFLGHQITVQNRQTKKLTDIKIRRVRSGKIVTDLGDYSIHKYKFD